LLTAWDIVIPGSRIAFAGKEAAWQEGIWIPR
jgi:hypothetical protein